MSFRIERLETVDSTNEEIHRRARAGAEEGLWITAARQTAGRGRRGRVWRSGERDLAASVLLRPQRRRSDLTLAAAGTLSFIAALALHDALRALGARGEVRLKWPNDALIGGSKVAGLLLEAEGAAEDPWIALGVGLNLESAPPAAALEPGATPATSLAAEGLQVTPSEALSALSAAFAPRYERWLIEGFAGAREEWLARAAGLGGPIVARLSGAQLSGRFVDVDASGALVLHTADGARRIHAADVFLPSGAA